MFVSHSTQMKPYVCVTELYKHMMTESAKLQRGTVHAEDWLFEHGAALKLMQQPLGNCSQSEFWGAADAHQSSHALIQLTCVETIAWTKAKIGPNGISYYESWFLPKFDLNNLGTVFFERLVGNHPEWMIWDDCLNKDVDDGAGYHVSLTSELVKDDKRKFDLSTLAWQDRAYLRPLDSASGLQFGTIDGGFPNSVRIIANVKRCYGENITAVVVSKGKPVKLSIGNRHIPPAATVGHGPRTKGAAEQMDWLHDDVKGVSADMFVVAKAQAAGKPIVIGVGAAPYFLVCYWMAGCD
jgi:hypothetical protein